MSGNTFKQNETVFIEVELESVNSSISDVDITITNSITGTTVVPKSIMEEEGNQKYSYWWDTRVGYAEYSGFSGWSGSGYSWWSGTSGAFSGWTGYSMAVSGLFTTTVTARDSNNHYGAEVFKIRIA
jgi:hypothetical protein